MMRGGRAAGIVAGVAACVAACGSFVPASEPTDGGTEPDGGTETGGGDGNASADTSAADGGACVLPTCAGETSCKSWTFDSGALAPCQGWTFAGDLADTTHDCSSGNLHVAAGGTLDITATASVDNPKTPYRLRVAMRMRLAEWNAGLIFAVSSGGNIVAQLAVIDLGAGNRRIQLCDAELVVCSPGTVVLTANLERLVVLETDGTGTTLTVDCVRVDAIPPVALATDDGSRTELVFGRNDANPIDGTIDDVSVTFRF
jgi:hypothetical protein